MQMVEFCPVVLRGQVGQECGILELLLDLADSWAKTSITKVGKFKHREEAELAQEYGVMFES